MKSEAEISLEVAGIDDCINRTREKMAKTDETINALLKLNSNRRDYLNRLGASRSELQTYELNLNLEPAKV